jgi:hypothetical protein
MADMTAETKWLQDHYREHVDAGFVNVGSLESALAEQFDYELTPTLIAGFRPVIIEEIEFNA